MNSRPESSLSSRGDLRHAARRAWQGAIGEAGIAVAQDVRCPQIALQLYAP
jgi:hypothetical protein